MWVYKVKKISNVLPVIDEELFHQVLTYIIKGVVGLSFQETYLWHLIITMKEILLIFCKVLR